MKPGNSCSKGGYRVSSYYLFNADLSKNAMFKIKNENELMLICILYMSPSVNKDVLISSSSITCSAYLIDTVLFACSFKWTFISNCETTTKVTQQR